MSSMDEAIASRYDLTTLPAELHANVLRHQRNLAELVESLRSVGLDEATIERSVRDLVEAYHAELLAAFHSLAKGPSHD